MASKKRGSKRKQPRTGGSPAGARSITGVSRSRSNLVIGLTGPFGSGCSTMRDILSQAPFAFHSFKIAEDIRREIEQMGKPVPKGKKGWRRVLQEHGNARRKERTGYWVDKVVDRIDEAGIGDEGIVIDGFRNPSEVQEIRRIYPNFFLVAICAGKEQRWSRVRKDYNGNQNEFGDDDRRDQYEDFKWGQGVQKCVDDADYVWYNNEHLVVSLEGGENPDSTSIERALGRNTICHYLSMFSVCSLNFGRRNKEHRVCGSVSGQGDSGLSEKEWYRGDQALQRIYCEGVFQGFP